MLKNDSLTAAAFVLSLLAILFSVANFNFSPSTDAFVGIMAGLIGVCATIMVGFQIFNSIDTKNKLEEFNKAQSFLKEELIQAKKERIRDEHIMKYGVNTAFGLSLYKEQPFTAFLVFCIALKEALEANDAVSVKKGVSNLSVCIKRLKKSITDKSEISFTDINKIEETRAEDLKKYDLYLLIEKEYETIYNEMLQLVTGLKKKENNN